MCHKGTIRSTGRLLLVLLAGVAALCAQDWRKVGGTSIELMLASPATGPVDVVWFSADGGALLARTRSGRVFQTADYESWTAVTPAPEPPVTAVPAAAARLPEAGARVISTVSTPGRIWALGRQLFSSQDGGRSWDNLTAYQSASVIGPGQHSVAVSPGDPEQIVVANDFGVWRSLDGGRSWSGLNQSFPNLAVRRILATPNGRAGARIQAENLGVLELTPGSQVWTPDPITDLEAEAKLRGAYSRIVGAEISAVATADRTVYIGSTDGRLWVSIDGGQSFRTTQTPTGTSGKVERIFADPAEPRVALAALSYANGAGPRVLRTTSSGNLWDALDGNLPDGAVHGITADRAAGAVYVATDRGVFYAQTDLEGASSPVVSWTSLSDHLPSAPATDVRLDSAGVQLYAALDGYGVFAVAAPHRASNLKIVNAADFSARAAAPGSLLSVLGGQVTSASAAGMSYPVLAVLGGDSQIQVPFEAEGPNVSLALQTSAGEVLRGLTIQAVSPAIFVGRDGVPMLLDADSGMPLDARNPAHAGGRIQILATGLGKVRPDWPAGMAAPMENPPQVAATVGASLDGQQLQVTRATLAPGYVGFYVIEAQLPAVLNPGVSELHITAAGQDSNSVQVVIQ